MKRQPASESRIVQTFATGGGGPGRAARSGLPSEQQYRDLHEASPDAVVVVGPAGLINFANNRVETLLGYSPHELTGSSPEILMPGRHREAHGDYMRRFVEAPSPRMMGGGLELVALRKDGSEFPAEISLSPYTAPEGLLVVASIRDLTGKAAHKGVLESENIELQAFLSQARSDAALLLQQAGITATEQASAARLQRLLLEELHHRVKNLLAVAMAITSQSLRNAESLEQGRSAIESRLLAMGRAQDLLLQTDMGGAQLCDVIAAAVAPFETRDFERISIHCDPISIGSEAVLPLTLSLNELCTNAVKYGALSNESGRVEVTSSVDEAKQLLTLAWVEAGGPTVREPTRRSFGTRLLGSLAAQLHAQVGLQYDPSGVRYQLTVPLAALGAPTSDVLEAGSP